MEGGRREEFGGWGERRAPSAVRAQDSYEDDSQVRHCRPRWAMAMYYPHDVSAEFGPTGVVPPPALSDDHRRRVPGRG
jgi:hypothetical protein